jgi:AcrR family transcriptional regulator
VSGARELFARQGYGATSMQAVAKAADVAVQTVYAIFGTKRAVLIAILDAADAETGTRTLPPGFARAPGTRVRSSPCSLASACGSTLPTRI